MNHKYKAIDKQKLIQEQNKQRKKYGLEPHKRLDVEMVIYRQLHSKTDELQTNEFGGMYA